jgi:hypothetical protein
MKIVPLVRTSRRGKKNGGNGIKYFIDCINSENNHECNQIIDAITNKEIIYSKTNPELAIIQSIMENYMQTAQTTRKTRSYKSKSKTVKKPIVSNKIARTPIVIKTWHYVTGYDGIYKEFNIGKQLQSICGFMKFIAFMQCFDNSYSVKPRTEIETELGTSSKKRKDIITLKINNEKICQGTDDIKQMLIMPYYAMGSISAYDWNQTNGIRLRTTFERAILSCYAAFIKFGFVHNDLHLQNILIENTNKSEIIYDFTEHGFENIRVKTNGIRIIIMDFERSITDDYSDTKNYDVTAMLHGESEFQTSFSKIIRQRKMWEDFRRLLNELDDINGVKIKRNGDNKRERIEYKIGNFIKNKIDLFSNAVVREQFTEDEIYERYVQNLYRIKENNPTRIPEDIIINIQNALHNEIMKLYLMITTVEFVDK